MNGGMKKFSFLLALIFFLSGYAYRAHADTAGNSTVVNLVVSNPEAITSAAPVGDIYAASQSVSLSCTDTNGPGCGSTYYTLNGTVPSASSSIYVSPITISSNTTLRYFSMDLNGIHGPAGLQTYVVDTVPPVTTAYPPAGDYNAAQSVTLACTDDNSGCAVTYYTTDGTTPTASSSQYSPSNPIFINATTTVKFFSTDLAGNDESPQTNVYGISLSATPPAGSPSNLSPGSPPGGGYANQTFTIGNLSVATASTSAIVSWDSSQSSVSILSWESDTATTGPGSSGSISEINYATEHSIFIQNLRPNQEYTITIDAVSTSGAVLHDSFFLQTLSVSHPPPDVIDLNATLSLGGNVLLSWQNPAVSDLDSVLITSGTRFFPRDPEEGYIVYQGKGQSALDFSAKPGSEYYYTAFTENTEGEYSPGVGAEFSYSPAMSSAETETSASQPLFGGVISVFPASSTDEIIFLNGSRIVKPQVTGSSSNSFLSVSINPDLGLTIIIPAGIVPRDTEEIIMKVFGVGDNAGDSFFIFNEKENESYETTIPASFDYGNVNSPFIISFLGIGSEDRVNGAFVIQASNIPQATKAGYGNGNNFLLSILILILLILLILTIGAVSRILLSGKKSKK